MIFTKLHLPKVDEHVVHRTGLFETLRNALSKKIILISATAGYGKTTLISDWINQHKLTAAWCSLDSRDNDPFLFLTILISSLNKQEKKIGKVSLELLQQPGNVSTEYILEVFINDLLSLEKEIVLVLDDLHLIDNKQVFEILSTLIDYKPDKLKLVLSTRSDPPLAFARLRSQNEILEIRSDKLSFTQDDIAFLFNKKLKMGLKQNDFAILQKKTEGWIAGLQLTALSVKGQGNISEYLERMAGDNRYIMDYLLEEVLQQQSQQERDFLLYTSILNRFNAPLCNFMLGIDNSQELIEDLERNNMFIIPLDNERNWFRYHHLFASLLKQRLALKYKDKLPELHNSASQWYENYEQLVFALEHSLAAGNKEKSLDHFANVINHLWETSQYLTILQFGGMFTHEEIVQNVGLCLNYFWILFQSGDMDQAESLIYKLKNRSTDKAVLAMVHVCINTLKITTGDIESSYTYSELGLQNIKEDVDYWTIFANLSLAEAHLLKFELKESFEYFTKAAASASKPQFIYFEMINRTRSSFVLWTMGDFAGAYKEGRDMLDRFNAAGADKGVGFDVLASIVYCLVGNFLINTNQIEEGLQKSLRGYELSKKTTNALLISTCTALLAEGYYLAGDFNKAISFLEELDAIPYKRATIFLCILSDLLKSKVYPLTSKLDQLKKLNEKDIKADKNNAFETIVNNIAKVRYQIAEGKIQEAIALLQNISEKLELSKAYGLLTEVNILQARAHSAILEQQQAMDHLLHALLRTQSVGLIRMYITEGEEIEELIKGVKSLKREQANKELDPLETKYINSILQAFEKEKSRQKFVPDEDELSSRELDTLNLLVLGLSNQEIAAKLFISNNTVKTHVRNILFKLEAKNRNDAVLKAKEKGIVPS